MVKRVEGNKESVYTYDLDRLIQIEEKEDGVTTSIKTLAYDDAGNLFTDGEFTYTWQMGRQLQGITGTGLTTSYMYNENGLRTQKTVNGQTHEYTLLGSNVTREVIRDNAGNILWTIHYSYAGEGTPVSMNVNGTEYYYLKNAQGDITHIVDEEGNVVASYEYDAWGTHLSITGGEIAELNPYRYRGYRYDSETGLYYVSSRYYDPETCRFINADDTDILDGGNDHMLENNLFAYCFNNPVNMTDEDGHWPSWATKIAIGVGAVLIGAAVVAATAATGGAAAAFIGAAVAGVKAAAISGAIGAAVGAGTSAVSHRVSTGSWSGSGKAALGGAVDGFASGFMTGGIMAGGSQVVSSGFKVAAKMSVNAGKPVSSGIKLSKNVKILSPDKLYHKTNGGTLLKIGKTFRIDINSSTMLHTHFPGPFASTHFPIGIIGSGLYGGIKR